MSFAWTVTFCVVQLRTIMGDFEAMPSRGKTQSGSFLYKHIMGRMQCGVGFEFSIIFFSLVGGKGYLSVAKLILSVETW